MKVDIKFDFSIEEHPNWVPDKFTSEIVVAEAFKKCSNKIKRPHTLIIDEFCSALHYLLERIIPKNCRLLPKSKLLILKSTKRNKIKLLELEKVRKVT